jgi:PIN domain nuclease of toxin-antitoxin system
VTGYLLDTNTVLLALADPDRLGPEVRRALLAGRNVLSAIVYWEVMLKNMKGNLQVGDPRVWWSDAVEQLSATQLPLRPEHVAEIYELPPLHRDPFDRVLIAQATVERLTLVTTDTELPKYASAHLRVLANKP